MLVHATVWYMQHHHAPPCDINALASARVAASGQRRQHKTQNTEHKILKSQKLLSFMIIRRVSTNFFQRNSQSLLAKVNSPVRTKLKRICKVPVFQPSMHVTLLVGVGCLIKL